MAVETRKMPLYAEYRGPGPLAYGLRPLIGNRDHDCTKPQAPAYSMGAARPASYNKNPGPADYNLRDTLTAKGVQQKQAVTLKGRAPLPVIKDVKPGPGQYNSHTVTQGKLSTERSARPAIITNRIAMPDYRCGPAPATYSIHDASDKTVLRRPKWSFPGPRTHHGSIYMNGKGPAPADYGRPDPNATQRRAGVYSLGGRTRVPNYNSAKDNPGPGAYDPKLTRGKGFSMGERHSNHTILVLTDTDLI